MENAPKCPLTVVHSQFSELAVAVYRGLALVGEILLYVIFLAPYAVDQKLALVSLDMPAQAVLFGTVWPYYSVLHLFALMIGLALLALRPNRAILSDLPLSTYVAVNLIGIAALFYLDLAGTPVYWDFALEFLRLLSVVVLAVAIFEAHDFDPAVLVRALLLLLTTPLLFVIATNPTTFLFERGGRVNAPGLEVTSTGHVAALGLLLGAALPVRKSHRIPLILISGIALLISGARIPFVLAVIVLVAQTRHATPNRRKRFALLIFISALTALSVAVASSGLVGGGRMSLLAGGSTAIESNYSLGRGLAAVTALTMIHDHPFGYEDSDWSVQQELVRLGFPSHTHSSLFQSYLRFGPVALLFWITLLLRARKGWRLNSPYAGALWFVLLGSLLDYYGCITKAMLVVFMISHLNESYIREAGTVSNPRSSYLRRVC